MKIPAHVNIEAFLRMIDSCAGTVELVSTEGDCLNLKSKLCQYIFIPSILSSDYSRELELVFEKPEDEETAAAFFKTQV